MRSLVTPRTILEPVVVTDAGAVLSLRSDPAVNRYLARKPMETIEEAIAFLEKIRAGYLRGDTFYWAIRQSEAGELIGSICLWNFSADKMETELGYEMRSEFQGQGLMKEAISAVLHFAFTTLELNKIAAYTHRENQASMALLARNGFQGPFEPAPDYEYNDFVFILERPPL